MVEAYVFVRIRTGWAKKIVRELGEVPEVATVHACWGQPDIIAYVKWPIGRSCASWFCNGSTGWKEWKPPTPILWWNCDGSHRSRRGKRLPRKAA